MKNRILCIVAALAMFALPATAQFTVVSQAPVAGSACQYGPGLAIDMSTGELAGCGNNRVWAGVGSATTQTFTNKTFDTAGTGNVFKSNGTPLTAVTGQIGVYQGTTATAITTGAFVPLTGPTTQKIAAGTANAVNKTVVVEMSGVYTNAAASLLNVELSLCTVAGCGSGTVVSPTGCVFTSTNQANNLTAGQWYARCTFVTATTGASATLMAKGTGKFNLGSATTAALSEFGDIAGAALSSAVDLTVDEFVQPQFKFTTSNAGNSSTLTHMAISIT